MHLEGMRVEGFIVWLDFESITFKLAEHRCRFTPDFIVQKNDGTVIAYEVKGHWEDDARVKIKVAAKSFPWVKFVGVMWVKDGCGGHWKYEEF